MRIFMWLGMTLALASVATGCGKAEGGATPVARQDIAEQVAELVCGGFGGCCQDQGYAFDRTECQTQTRERLEGEWSQYLSTTTYDANAAGECLAYYREHARCGVVFGKDADGAVEACSNIFVGHAKPGDLCNESMDCEDPATGDAYCNHDSAAQGSSAQGVCVVEELVVSAHGKLGESCLSSCDSNECEAAPAPAPGAPAGGTAFCYRSDGLYCEAGACAKLVEPGGACQGSDACDGDHFCSSGVCSARQADGGACESDSDCQSSNCESGVCVPLTPSAEACASGSPFNNSTD